MSLNEHQILANYLKSTISRFSYYKQLGERAMEQLNDEDLFFTPDSETNSIGIIVKHLWGNMQSRWTNFLHSDGEKEWRKRDTEFELDFKDRKELISRWEEGWHTLINTLESLTINDLGSTVKIRNEEHTVVDAINRQLAHYAYHVGQIVFLAKMIKKSEWKSLSIPKGQSQAFNQNMFGNNKM